MSIQEHAKDIGKLLRTTRLKQGISLSSLNHKTGISITQLLALENGNPHAFNSNSDQMYETARTYAKTLGINIQTIVSTQQSNMTATCQSDFFIPLSIRKRD